MCVWRDGRREGRRGNTASCVLVSKAGGTGWGNCCLQKDVYGVISISFSIRY